MPRPLHDGLPPDIGSVEIAVFDVDGTLARDDAKVSEQTINALGELASAGIHVVLASGRMAPRLAALLGRTGQSGYVIGCNGAVSMHTTGDEIVATAPMDDEFYADVLDFSAALEVPLIVFGPFNYYTDDHNPWRGVIEGPNDGVLPLHAELATLDSANRLKVMFYVPPGRHAEVLPRLRERFPASAQTSPEVFELTAPGVDKWSGLRPILDELATSPDRTLGIGDSENDLTWLPKVGISIAMNNAYPQVKQACDYQIGHNDADAVADFVSRWLVEIRGG